MRLGTAVIAGLVLGIGIALGAVLRIRIAVLALRLLLRLRCERAALHLLHHADGGVDRDGEADALVAAGLGGESAR